MPLTVQGHAGGCAQATTHWHYCRSLRTRPDTHGIDHAGQHSDARGFLPPRIPVPVPTRSAKEEVQWHHSTASIVTHSPQDVPRTKQMGGSIGRHFVPHILLHDMAQPSVGPACKLLNELAGYE